MTIKAIIEMMDKLGFSNTAKHRVSYDLLESSMYIPVDREGSPLSKVLDMVNIEEILKSTPLDSYERISPSILSGIVNKFAKYQLLNADNVKIGLVIHYKGGRTLALYLNDSIKLKEDNIRRAKEMYAKTKRVPKNAIPVTYNGTHYRSKAECMACEDISSFQLERYLKNIDTKK